MDRKVVVKLERIKALDEAALARKNSSKERPSAHFRFTVKGHVMVPLIKRQENVQDGSEKER